MRNTGRESAAFIVPADAAKGETIHIVCEVQDGGTPQLTQYLRFIIKVKS